MARTAIKLILALALLSLLTIANSGTVTPHNYYTASNSKHDKHLLHLVEKYHLDKARRLMQRDSALKWAMGDVTFMLAHFPNHPIALQLATEVTKRMGTPKRADQYYKEAVRLYPRSAETWVLYGIHLHRTARVKEAVDKYKHAIELNDASVNAHYNLGLALVALGRLDDARVEAKRAYALGHPLPGLKTKLQAEGAW